MSIESSRHFLFTPSFDGQHFPSPEPETDWEWQINQRIETEVTALSPEEVTEMVYAIGRRISDALFLLLMQPGHSYSKADLAELLYQFPIDESQSDKRAITSKRMMLALSATLKTFQHSGLIAPVIQEQGTTDTERFGKTLRGEVATAIAARLLFTYHTFRLNPYFLFTESQMGYVFTETGNIHPEDILKWKQNLAIRLALLRTLSSRAYDPFSMSELLESVQSEVPSEIVNQVTIGKLGVECNLLVKRGVITFEKGEGKRRRNFDFSSHEAQLTPLYFSGTVAYFDRLAKFQDPELVVSAVKQGRAWAQQLAEKPQVSQELFLMMVEQQPLPLENKTQQLRDLVIQALKQAAEADLENEVFLTAQEILTIVNAEQQVQDQPLASLDQVRNALATLSQKRLVIEDKVSARAARYKYRPPTRGNRHRRF